MKDSNKKILIMMAIDRQAGSHESLRQIAKGDKVLMTGLSENENILAQHLARKRLIEGDLKKLQSKEELGQLQTPTIAYKEKLKSEKYSIEDWLAGKADYPTTWNRDVLDKFPSNLLEEIRKDLNLHPDQEAPAASGQKTDQGSNSEHVNQQAKKVPTILSARRPGKQKSYFTEAVEYLYDKCIENKKEDCLKRGNVESFIKEMEAEMEATDDSFENFLCDRIESVKRSYGRWVIKTCERVIKSSNNRETIEYSRNYSQGDVSKILTRLRKTTRR